MPRYVVLHHTGHGDAHYDLMLAMDDVSLLLTWRLPHWPPAPSDIATAIADHRRAYLTYQGRVSGDRGEVRRVAEGEFEVLHDSPSVLRVRLEDHHVVIDLPRNDS